MGSLAFAPLGLLSSFNRYLLCGHQNEWPGFPYRIITVIYDGRRNTVIDEFLADARSSNDESTAAQPKVVARSLTVR